MQINPINPYGHYRQARAETEDRAAQTASTNLAKLYASNAETRAGNAERRAQGAYDANQQNAERERLSALLANEYGPLARKALESGNPQQTMSALLQNPAIRQKFQQDGIFDPDRIDVNAPDFVQGLQAIAGFTAGNSDPEGFGQPQTVVGPDGKPSLVQFGNRGTSRPVEGYQPSPLEQYGRVNPGDYTPESLAKYAQTRNFSDLVRIWAPTVETVGSVPTVVGRQVGGGVAPGGAPNRTPLSTLETEAGGKAAIAGAEAGAAATAKSESERMAAIQKKGSDAVGVIGMLDMADPLIAAATGSLAGAAADKLVGWLGFAPSGAEAIASLQILQAGLMLNMPRMEGPQSDRDVQLYKQAAAQLGDPTVPRELKTAAVGTIRQLQQKYQQRAGTAGSAVRVNSPQEAAKLPPGTRFITPDGQERVRR